MEEKTNKLKQRVYLLGAGFSKALNKDFPTLHELSEKVRTNFNKRYISGAIKEHYNTIPEIIKTDIEQLLNYLFIDWPWKTSIDKDLDNALYKALTYEISNYISSLDTDSIKNDYITFLRHLTHGENTIITLNYDMLFEKMARIYARDKTMSKSGVDVYIEDEFDDLPRKTTNESPFLIERIKTEKGTQKRVTIKREFIDAVKKEEFYNTVKNYGVQWSKIDSDMFLFGYKIVHEFKYIKKLLKLHGSIDWNADYAENIRIISGDGSIKKKKLPLIIPPVFDKSKHYLSDEIRDLWFTAHSKIENADEIIIIGFSFPVADISVRFLFQDALSKNLNARIIVVNIDSEKNLRARYDCIFHNMNINLDYSYSGVEDALERYIKYDLCHY